MRIYVFIALTLTCSVFLFAESRLEGKVTDSVGAAIAGAVIFVHWDSSGSTVGFRSNVGTKSTFHRDSMMCLLAVRPSRPFAERSAYATVAQSHSIQRFN